MNLTIENHNGFSLLIAEGAVKEQALRGIAEALDSLPLAAKKHVLLDCSGVKELIHSSVGFSGFVSHLLYFKSRQADIVLFGCNQQTLTLLELLKLDDAFRYAQTLDEAYLSLLPKEGAELPSSHTQLETE